jgi:hypothetical protein
VEQHTTAGRSTHLGGDHKDSHVRWVEVVGRPGSKAAYAHSLHYGIPVVEQRRFERKADDIRSAVAGPVTSGVEYAREKVPSHGESGMNSLADVAALTRMHMLGVKVIDDASDREARQHRSRASGLKTTLPRHSKSVKAHRCRRVCQHGCDFPRAMRHLRTEASHTGSCRSNPAYATEFEAG